MDTYIAIIHHEGEFFVSLCPETGTVSQGKSIDESITNLNEATELYLEEFPASHHSRSFITITVT